MVIVLYRFSGLSTGLEDRVHGYDVARTLKTLQIRIQYSALTCHELLYRVFQY